MSQSWFGGDPSKAHWHVSPKYELSHRAATKELRAEARARNEKLRTAVKKYTGKTEWYYQYSVKDEKQKAAQKISAEALAKELEQELGFPFEVCEGCFL
jgi:hypothetical protein